MAKKNTSLETWELWRAVYMFLQEKHENQESVSKEREVLRDFVVFVEDKYERGAIK